MSMLQKALTLQIYQNNMIFLEEKLKALVLTHRKEDPITDEWLATRVELTPVKKGKTFNKNGINVKVEYTSEELSFYKKTW